MKMLGLVLALKLLSGPWFVYYIYMELQQLMNILQVTWKHDECGRTLRVNPHQAIFRASHVATRNAVSRLAIMQTPVLGRETQLNCIG